MLCPKGARDHAGCATAQLGALHTPPDASPAAMELLVVAGAYVAGVLLLVFIMLFGESELFARTPVSWAHWLITSGICQGIE